MAIAESPEKIPSAEETDIYQKGNIESSGRGRGDCLQTWKIAAFPEIDFVRHIAERKEKGEEIIQSGLVKEIKWKKRSEREKAACNKCYEKQCARA